jgi:endoglucanase
MIMKKYLLIITAIMIAVTPVIVKAQSAKFISVKGKDIMGPNGKPFLMRGTNLGNWLIPEGYMFFANEKSKINSPKLINEALVEMIGPDETKAFWGKYLDSYITQADINFLKSTGMNSIRIPFSYKLFTNEDYLGENNADHGFELLDKVISWCKTAGLYVVLDYA